MATKKKHPKKTHHKRASAATREIHRLHARWLRVQIRDAKKKARNAKLDDQQHRYAIERLKKLSQELAGLTKG